MRTDKKTGFASGKHSTVAANHMLVKNGLEFIGEVTWPCNLSLSSTQSYQSVGWIEKLGFNQKRCYRAAVLVEYGKPFEIKDLKSKELKPDQVRVKIHSSAMNFADLLIAKDLYQVKYPPPFTSGIEFAGVVTEVGKDSKLKVGTRVGGMEFQSGHAEETVIEDKKLFALPDNMDLKTAGGYIASYVTALFALKYKGQVKKGETVLVMSAAGALGLATIDLAKNAFGVNVIGAAGGPEKCKFLEENGVKAIDYNNESIRDVIKKTNPKGVDVVLETIGGDIFTDCLKSMAVNGRLLSLGFTSGKFPTLPVNYMMVKNITVTGINWGAFLTYDIEFYREVMQAAYDIFQEGKLKPYNGTTFKLNEINDAYAFMAKRKSIGKVLINMQ